MQEEDTCVNIDPGDLILVPVLDEKTNAMFFRYQIGILLDRIAGQIGEQLDVFVDGRKLTCLLHSFDSIYTDVTVIESLGLHVSKKLTSGIVPAWIAQ